MKRTVMILILVLVLVFLAAKFAEEQRKKPGTVGELLARAGNNATIGLVTSELDVDADDRLLSDTYQEKVERSVGLVEEVFLAEGGYLRVACVTGELIRYGNSTAESKRKNSKGPVSKEEFIGIVQRILQFFEGGTEFTFDLQDGRAYSSFVSRKSEEYSTPTEDDYWEINVPRVCCGYECLSSVTIRVHMLSHRVAMVSNLPFVKPTEMVENISKKQTPE